MTINGNDSVFGLDYGIEYNADKELAVKVLFQDYPRPLLYFASACCVLFTLVGIPGNLTTIIALARYKKVRNATAIFIINLHISDLIFCCMILPMTAMTYSQEHWTHGVIMCRVYPFFKYMLNAVAIFTILAISINRYVIVCHPLWYPRLYKRRNMSIMLLTLWISSIALFLPSAVGAWGEFNLEPKGGFCTMLEDKNHHSPKKLFLIIGFIGPYLTILLCYARIWWVVRKTVNKSKRQIPRPTHLPLSHTESDPSNDRKKIISLEPSTSGNSITEDDNSRNNSASTPNEDKVIENYFKAPFRMTRKELRSKTPMRREKKLCTMIAAIMISYCISHLPMMTTRILYKEYNQKPVANVFAHLLEYLGNCMNPIIYVLMSSEYRQAYKNLLETVMKKFYKH